MGYRVWMRIYPLCSGVPFIKRLRAGGKSVVVDLNISELEPFMQEMAPEGLLLCIATDSEDQEKEIIKKLENGNSLTTNVTETFQKLFGKQPSMLLQGLGV